MSKYTLNAVARDVSGKGASRRLRRLENLVPGIVYGGKKKPASITLKHNELIRQLQEEAFYASVLTLDIDGKEELVVLKDLQRHPARDEIVHLDLLRVSKTKKFKKIVPLHFLNEENALAVKNEGGKVTHNVTEIEVSCLPANLPEFLEVDLMDVEIGQVVHISDIKMPKGVESVELSHGASHDQAVASISKPKGVAEDDEAPASEEAPAAE